MKQYIKELFHQASLIFYLAVFAICVTGMIFSDETTGIFSLSGGLSYITLFQLFLFSILTAAMVTYALQEDRFPHLSFRKRILFLLGGAYLLTIVFIILFGWIPTDDSEAWLMFHLAFFISTLFSYLIIRCLYLEQEKRYGILLQRYKDQRREEK